MVLHRDTFKRMLFLLILIILISLSVRLLNIDRSLWHDEIVSMHFAEYSIDRLLPTVENDPHPGLFYVLLKYWSTISTGEFMLRLLPVVFEVGAIITGALISYQFLGLLPTLVFALLISVNPASLVISQLLRNYSILSFFTVLTGWSLTRIRQIKTPSLLDMLFLFISGVFTLYSHFAGIFVIFILSLLQLWHHFTRTKSSDGLSLPGSLTIGFGWAIAFVPALLNLLNQPKGKWTASTTIYDFINNISVLVGSFSFLGTGSMRFWVGMLYSLGMLVVAGIGFAYLWMEKRELRPFIILTFVPLLYFAVALAQEKAFRLRYTASFTIPILICLSIGLVILVEWIVSQFTLQKKFSKSVLIGFFLLIACGLNIYRVTQTMAVVQRDWKSAAQYLELTGAKTLLFQKHHKHRTCLNYYVPDSINVLEITNDEADLLIEKSTINNENPIFYIKQNSQQTLSTLSKHWNINPVKTFDGQLSLELYRLEKRK